LRAVAAGAATFDSRRRSSMLYSGARPGTSRPPLLSRKAPAMNEESLFAAALQMPSGAARRAFLDQACAGDAGLRQRLERLLAADAETAGVLDQGQDAAALLGAYRP